MKNMSYSINETWEFVKNIEGTFWTREVYEMIQRQRPDVNKTTFPATISDHLRRLTTQGYLRIVSAGYINGAYRHQYEVIYHG